MQSTLKKIENNTKNFARNLTAGAVLASTVASTDLVENLTTTLTRPTSNMIQTIENTSEALGQTLKNTSQGNFLHSIGNTVTLLPRAIGTSVEGIVKTASHATQYVSGASQIISNGLMTGGKSAQQSFSTTDASPDISHQEINLKDPTLLGRDGTHGLLQKKEPPRTKIGRWLGNVKNSLFNIPLNIGRIGTDIVTSTAQRVRGVIESVEGMSKDIKSSRSGVFTKGQSFGKKFGNIFTKGVRGSVKSLGKGGWNIINEGILKSGVAVVGIGSNFVGRTLGNTVVPLFSTKAGRDQKDNVFDGSSRQESFSSYYTSTPRKKSELSESSPTDKSESENTTKEGVDKGEDTVEQPTKKGFFAGLRPFGKKKSQSPDPKEELKKEDNTTSHHKEVNSTLGALLETSILTVDALKKAQKSKNYSEVKKQSDTLLTEFKYLIKDQEAIKNIPTEYTDTRETIQDTVKDIGEGKYNHPDHIPQEKTKESVHNQKNLSQKELSERKEKLTTYHNNISLLNNALKKKDTEKLEQAKQSIITAHDKIQEENYKNLTDPEQKIVDDINSVAKKIEEGKYDIPGKEKQDKEKKSIDPTHITKEIIKNNPDTIFLFGDNEERQGDGGKAKEMRNAGPNSIGIATLLGPDKPYTKDTIDQSKKTITDDINKVIHYAKDNNITNITIPKDKNGEYSIGSGIAGLHKDKELKPIREHLQKELTRAADTVANL